MAGLFDTFNISKRGLSVQQANINTTSHNIANASTVGYSRQRAVVETTRPFGGMSRFDSCSAGQVGTGAEVTTIQRIRDVFKDYQVRLKKTDYGALEKKDEYLTRAIDVLNETSDTGIQDALSTFYNVFSTLSLAPEKSSNRTVAIQQASTLANAINTRYTELENNKADAQSVLQTSVININSILDQVNELNKQIAGVSAVGLSPNDLMDRRDNLLDELSTQFGITTKREKHESMDISVTEATSIGKLVDGTDFTSDDVVRFSYVEGAELNAAGTTLTVKYSVFGDNTNTEEIQITGTKAELEQLSKDLYQNRILVADKEGTVTPTALTVAGMNTKIFKVEKGEIGGIQKVQDNIQKTMDDLNAFAAGLAYSVNAIQIGSTDATANAGLANKDLLFVTKASDGTLTPTDTGINAKNITVNSVLLNDSSKLNCGLNDTSGEKDGSRALAISKLSTIKMDFSKISVTDTSTRIEFFTNTATSGSGLSFETSDKLNLKSSTTGSTMGNFYTSIVSNLATVAKGISSDLTNAEEQLKTFENDRLSESGVSLDEEASNLIQFQHAYQANAKVMSTIDELLDVVINGLKR